MPIPGYRNFLIYGDESGMHNTSHFGFVTLLIPQEARGRLSGLLTTLRNQFCNEDEVKWTKINKSRKTFYVALLNEIFRKNWIMFHAILVRKTHLTGDPDLERRKKIAMLLRDKIQRFAAHQRNKYYHVRVDPLPTRYLKAGEAAHIIVNRGLKKKLGYNPILSLREVQDSKTSAGIQIVDVLLGAFMSGWLNVDVAEPKRQVRQELLDLIGWPDFRADTRRSEWKFNIWVYHIPGRGLREVRWRKLKLRYQAVPYGT